MISNHPLVYSWLDPYLHLIFYTGTGFVLFCASFISYESFTFAVGTLTFGCSIVAQRIVPKWYCRQAIAKVSLWMGLDLSLGTSQIKTKILICTCCLTVDKRSLRFYEVHISPQQNSSFRQSTYKFVCQKKDPCMTVRPGRLQIPLSNRYLPNKYLRNGR